MLPVGRVNGPAPEIIAAHIAAFYALDAVVLPPFALPEKTLDPKRRQHDAGRLIHFFENSLPARCRKLIAVLDVDMFVPIFTHVFGEARLGGRVAVVSLFRLSAGAGDPRDAQGIIFERAAKIALHELGHLFNLEHCDHPGCMMQFAGGLTDLDRLELNLCRYCRMFLREALFFPI